MGGDRRRLSPENAKRRQDSPREARAGREEIFERHRATVASNQFVAGVEFLGVLYHILQFVPLAAWFGSLFSEEVSEISFALMRILEGLLKGVPLRE